MIAVDSALTTLVRATAPLVFRSDAAIARKLAGFACTEAGSALDMLRAAERTRDARLRRLFLRHALDEARHATLFRAAARALCPEAAASGYERVHARPQDLYVRLGEVRFVAFVHLAELRGEAQFRAIARQLGARTELAELFARIAKDERFHVAYTKTTLLRWTSEGRGKEVRRALLTVRASRAWEAWRRAGRKLGDVLTTAILAVLYALVLPPFALAARLFDPERPGWKSSRALPDGRAAARRPF